MQEAVAQLCNRRVVLLGEASHGDGETFAFKAELVQRLVGECGFSAVMFESSLYEFGALERRLRDGESIDAGAVLLAIGGIWNRAGELQRLARFLAVRANAGQLTLAGLDDQLQAGPYMQGPLAAVLGGYLEAGPASADQGTSKPDGGKLCQAALQRHMQWSYSSEAPYSSADQSRLLACLKLIGGAIDQSRADQGLKSGHRQEVENLIRSIGRDVFEQGPPSRRVFNLRHQSMFRNLQWHRQRLAPEAKLVVWTHNIHAAKSLSAIDGMEGAVSLGARVRRADGEAAFALGFSAQSGHFARIRSAPVVIPIAPVDSIEASVSAESGIDPVYLDGTELGRMGKRPGRLLNYELKQGQWNRVVDGLIVFPVERSPRY